MIKHITLPVLLAAGLASADSIRNAPNWRDLVEGLGTPAATLAVGSAAEAKRTIEYKYKVEEKLTSSQTAAAWVAADATDVPEQTLADYLLAELDANGKKIVSITIPDGTQDEDGVYSTIAADLVSSVVSGTIEIIYAEEVEVVSNADMEKYIEEFYAATTANGGLEGAGTVTVEVESTALKSYEWEATGKAKEDEDAVDEDYRTVQYTLTFESSKDLTGSENFMSSELVTELVTLDSSDDAVVTLTTTTLAKKASTERRLRADTAYTYTSTVTIVYPTVAVSKLDLGLPKLADKGVSKLQDILETVAESDGFVLDDKDADDYIVITAKSLTRDTPLVDGSKATRDLTASSDTEASRTLTVSAEFTSTKKFSTAEITELEGQVSNEMIALDTNKNIISVDTDVAEQAAAAARRLLATYSYDSSSTVVTISAQAATDTKTLLATSLTADGFKTILADAATAAGISGATFAVKTAPVLAGGTAAASSGASAAILGGALGLFAAVAALL